MKSLNRFLGITALILTVVLIASVAGGVAYIADHKGILTDFKDLNFLNNQNMNFNFSLSGQKSSDFETLKTTQSDVYPLQKSIILDVAVDDVIFIEEDRTDILVDYYREHPNATAYSVTYKSEAIDHALYITSTYSVTDLFIDQDYQSTITIHVPNGFTCETLDLRMSLGEIKDASILNGAKNVVISSKLGNVDLTINSPKDSLSIKCDMGDINLTVKAPITTFDATANFGQMTLDLQDKIGTMWCDLSMGSLDITTNGSIDAATFSAKMGSIDGDFGAHIEKLTATADMGSISIHFANNEDSSIYADANAGSIDSDLPIVKESADPDFKFYANMGSIDISSN